MQFADFRALVQRLEREIPAEFQGGVVSVEVSPKTVPHPVHAEIYTMGECIPLEWSGGGADVQSRVVLYHGSFQALARLSDPGDFDWRSEAWETLTHELRHHLEWRANQSALEAYDWAAEQNFARHEGQGFDPTFYRSGEKIADGVWKVEDDVFVEREPGALKDSLTLAGSGEPLSFVWHGRSYTASVPDGPARASRFLILEGLDEPPPGDAVLVLRRRARWWDLLRRPAAPVTDVVQVEPT